MFPVLSILRRCPTAAMYIEERDVRVVEDRRVLPLQKPTQVWGQHGWEQQSFVPLYQLRVSAKTSRRAALLLSQTETQIGERLGALSCEYTLVLGPEKEETSQEKGGWIVRTVVVGVALGVLHSPNQPVIAPPRLLFRRQRRPGILHERR